MFHYKLIELESELAAKEESAKGLAEFPPECSALMEYVQQEIGVQLANLVPKDWKGWLSYLRGQSLIVCRGRAFKEGMFGKVRAGLDLPGGLDSVTESQRGFDVSPPQEDHLLLNFGGKQRDVNVYLWYGENISPYKLIYKADLEQDPHTELSAAIVEACTWILTRPKHQTLNQFLIEQAKKT